MSKGKQAPMSSTVAVRTPHRPQCDGKVRDHDQSLKRCKKDGLPVNITGEFGTNKGYLCMGCVKLTREKGWKVTYQLEGDKAICGE